MERSPRIGKNPLLPLKKASNAASLQSIDSVRAGVCVLPRWDRRPSPMRLTLGIIAALAGQMVVILYHHVRLRWCHTRRVQVPVRGVKSTHSVSHGPAALVGDWCPPRLNQDNVRLTRDHVLGLASCALTRRLLRRGLVSSLGLGVTIGRFRQTRAPPQEATAPAGLPIGLATKR